MMCVHATVAACIYAPSTTERPHRGLLDDRSPTAYLSSPHSPPTRDRHVHNTAVLPSLHRHPSRPVPQDPPLPALSPTGRSRRTQPRRKSRVTVRSERQADSATAALQQSGHLPLLTSARNTCLDFTTRWPVINWCTAARARPVRCLGAPTLRSDRHGRADALIVVRGADATS